MRIVGRGFLAGHLAPLSSAHPDVVAFAAGVSNASCTAPDAFAAETLLLRQTVDRARADGQTVLYFSTAAADMYGARDGPGREDEAALPTSPYGRHKHANERMLRSSGVDFLVVRLAHVVGAGQREHQLVPALTAQIRSGSVVVHRGARRDLIDVAHVVQCVDALLAGGLRNDLVNVASGFSVCVEDVVTHLEQRLGRARHVVVDRPSGCQVSTDKLARLVPAVTELGFCSEYFRHVLDRYLGVE